MTETERLSEFASRLHAALERIVRPAILAGRIQRRHDGIYVDGEKLQVLHNDVGRILDEVENERYERTMEKL